MTWSRRSLLVGLGAVGLGGAGAAGLGYGWWSRAERWCGPPLEPADLDAAIDLGARYLVAAQRPAGDFVYEVDWTTGRESKSDEPIRQAGATWGLATLVAAGHADVLPALDRSLGYWAERTTRTDAAGAAGDARAWVTVGRRRDLGAAALVGLALVDRLGSGLASPAGPTRDQRARDLDGLLASIRAARLPDGGFASAFDPDGAPTGAPNPYADGEALLLAVTAGLALDRPALVAEALGWARVDHQRNVDRPRAAEPDPDTTKGYYQWGSMAWYALAAAGHAPDELGGWLTDLARWMIHDHGTLARTRNTAYAYEGLIPAYAWARDHGDDALAAEIACVANQGLGRLFSWQLGHPRALPALRDAADRPGADRFVGGVQNEAAAPTLRIDVTQHQVHAALLARTHRIVG
ncbi:MAG: hypothetical protein ABMB14_13205 [Myxococcota bacterium]